jgi:hypothetical protein
MNEGDIALDDLDRAVVLFVHRYRREYQRGPLWRDVRDEVGIPYVDLSTDAFEDWWNLQPPDAYPSRSAARRAFTRAARNADPFPARMGRLRWAGYVRFDDRERSLDVRPRVRAWQAQRRMA